MFAGNNFPVFDAADARNRGFDMTTGVAKRGKPKKAESLRQSLDVDVVFRASLADLWLFQAKHIFR